MKPNVNVVFAAVGAVFLAACSPSGLSTQGQVLVWESKPDPALERIANGLPGNQIQHSSTSEGWLTLLRSGAVAPDLVVDEDGYSLRQAQSDALLRNLRPYWPRLASPTRLWPGLQVASSESVFLPSSVYVWGLFYNPAVLKRLGIVPPDDWASFEDALKTMKGNGMTPLALGASFGWPALAWISMVDLRLNGGKAADELSSGRRSFLDPSVLQTLSLLEKWRDLGWFDSEAATKNWPEALADVGAGRAGFLLLGAYGINRIADASQLAFLPFPEGPSRPSDRGELAVVRGYAVGARSLAPEAALALADAAVAAGSPGQLVESYWSSAIVATGEGFRGTQNSLLQKARFLVSPLDKVWAPETSRAAAVYAQQFFSSTSKVDAHGLAQNLERIRTEQNGKAP